VIPDGDIAFEDNFLEEVSKYHEKYHDLVLYFRRWDERSPHLEKKGRPSISTLRDTCRLTNPTNYGGCLTISRKALEYVRGYEEHELFSEAGANGMELYTRLKNAGFPIMWHPTHKIYHPWHEGTAPKDPEYKRKIDLQNLIIKKRDLNVVFLASSNEVDINIRGNLNNIQQVKNKISAVNKIKRFLFG
jgi:GT2 family glycosyltransferase